MRPVDDPSSGAVQTAEPIPYRPVPTAIGEEPPGRALRARVAVVEADPIVLAHLVDAAYGSEQPAPFDDLGELGQAAQRLEGPLVVVAGPSFVDDGRLEALAAFVVSRPRTAAVLVAEQLDARLARVVLRAGIGDVVPLDGLRADLPGAIAEVAGSLVHEEPAAPASPPPVPVRPRKARVTTCYSPKGGVGRSVLAVNLAAVLAARGRRTVLVDGDVELGDVALMLRLAPDHSVVDAAMAGEALDAVLLEQLCSRHESSGLSVLAAPGMPMRGDRTPPGGLARVLEVLRDVADHVVVDTRGGLSEEALELVQASDDVVLVASLDVPSLRGARIGVQVLQLMDVPLERVLVVLNRADAKVHLTRRDVERVLAMRVDVAVPSDGFVPQSVNQGLVAALERPRGRFAAAMGELAAIVLQRAEEAAARVSQHAEGARR
jgi:pilus assembly protein CpaE